MRWGLLPPKKLRECAWKKLYIQVCSDSEIKFFVILHELVMVTSFYSLVGRLSLLFGIDLDVI